MQCTRLSGQGRPWAREQKIDRKTSVAVRGETVLFIIERKRLGKVDPTSGHVSRLRWTNKIRDTEERDQSREWSWPRSSRSIGTRRDRRIIQMEFTKRASCRAGPRDRNWGSGSYERHFLCPYACTFIWFPSCSCSIHYSAADFWLDGNQTFYPSPADCFMFMEISRLKDYTGFVKLICENVDSS